MSKTTTLHVHHTFLYFSLLSLHDYHVKMPNFTFHGGRRKRVTTTSDHKGFFLFLNLKAVAKESTLEKFAYM